MEVFENLNDALEVKCDWWASNESAELTLSLAALRECLPPKSLLEGLLASAAAGHARRAHLFADR